jgi:hypothetical protein
MEPTLASVAGLRRVLAVSLLRLVRHTYHPVKIPIAAVRAWSQIAPDPNSLGKIGGKTRRRHQRLLRHGVVWLTERVLPAPHRYDAVTDDDAGMKARVRFARQASVSCPTVAAAHGSAHAETVRFGRSDSAPTSSQKPNDQRTAGTRPSASELARSATAGVG